MSKSVMIDLETLDTSATTIILQVAAVVFDSETFEILDQYDWFVNIPDQANKGRTISADTLAWWFSQSKDAQEVVANAFKAATDLSTVCKALYDVLIKSEFDPGTVVWTQGNFDIPILQNAFAQNSLRWPLQHWQVGELRSVEKFAAQCGVDVKSKKKTIKDIYNAHNALDDCLTQIEVLKELTQCLNLKNESKTI